MARHHLDQIDSLYSAAQARELDRLALQELGLPGILLMKRAGRSAFALLRQYWPVTSQIEVFCGVGNNAGDGYVLAGLAAAQGWQVQVWEVAAERVAGDAAMARDFALESGVRLGAWQDYQALEDTQVLVDALLGTGFRGALKASLVPVIEAINARELPVLSLDLPSGLQADTGAADTIAVRATVTLSFGLMKAGLLTGAAPDYCSALWLEDLDLPLALTQGLSPRARVLGGADLQVVRRRRPRSAHKGQFGTLAVLGGDLGMGGAAMLAAESALASGVGRVRLVTRAAHVAAALARCPELMVQGLEDTESLPALLRDCTAVAVGPGLGLSSWSAQLLEAGLQAGKPMVIDADALTLLAAQPQQLASLKSESILTPHPGEAARLLGCTAAEIQSDRFDALDRLAELSAATIVLKGAGSLVTSPEQPFALCRQGNPGLSGAGTGDVLTGLIGALLARGLPVGESARAAVLLHALAGDAEAAAGEQGMRASELLPHIRRLINGLPPHD